MNEFQELTREFFLDARDRLARMEELLLALEKAEGDSRNELLIELKRELHTVKGNAGMMGFALLQGRAHELEDAVFAMREEPGGDLQPIIDGVDDLRTRLDETAAAVERGELDESSIAGGSEPRTEAPKRETAAAAPAATSTEVLTSTVAGSVRVPFQALDELVELLAEMVIFRNRLADSISQARHSSDEARNLDEIEFAHDALAKTLNGIQDRVMRLRMVPLRSLFGSLRRIVHDESRREGKEVRFDTSGGEVPIDKALLEVASEALGHLVRNAVIHGIEPRAARLAAGKPEPGSVRLSARSRTDDLLLEVADDGRGIDRAALVESAKRRGIDGAEGLSVENLVLRSGLSSRSAADLGSGRGIGVGAAREAVERVGGRVEVDTRPGQGSTFRLRLPLTVSILRTLIVVADGELYALPLANVQETLRFTEPEGHEINHALVYVWRGETLPVLDVAAAFGRKVVRRSGFVLVIESDAKRRAILADEISGIREIVVKGLDPMVGTPEGISGSTILGDGRVVLILDPRGLVSMSPFLEEDAPVAVSAEESLSPVDGEEPTP